MALEVKDSHSWEKPPINYVKCNVGSAWSTCNGRSGAAWILTDAEGKPILHSRRSFVGIRSQLEADLSAQVWATEQALCDLTTKRVVLETSSTQFPESLAVQMVPMHLQPL